MLTNETAESSIDHYNYTITINLYHFADVSKMPENIYTFCGVSLFQIKKIKKALISFAGSELIRIFALQNACTHAHDADETTIYKICQ